MQIKITSTAFENGGMIPEKYTCDGSEYSPPLSWPEVPQGTQSIALISDDPDAPMGTWVHWVLFKLPPHIKELPENQSKEKTLGNGASQGRNSSGKIGYQGPCPPSGTHRYYFKVYALDTKLDLEPGIMKAELVEAMRGHIIAEGELMGKYSRK